eukprot:TRINITY_DN4789_c0_g1_i10.p4 TRINITY_DN4789_c0_g1~~TRINITY_DN4789_c0_g1_i10.p4  ORF type:complete len:106 (+),score=32.24 TRINITY_DN4789_c0_g1_i10:268-585(+)
MYFCVIFFYSYLLLLFCFFFYIILVPTLFSLSFLLGVFYVFKRQGLPDGLFFFFFFFKQKTAYEMLRSLVGSEMCIRDRYQRRVRGKPHEAEARKMTPPNCSITF